jgi:hypothetical protein
MSDLDALVRERRLDREDFEIQIEAALASARRGFFATARAELRGAMMMLDKMQRRAEDE